MTGVGTALNSFLLSNFTLGVFDAFTDYERANKNTNSSYVTPSPSPRNSAKQDSFRDKLIRRNKSRTCDICAEDCPMLEATHIVDVAKREHLEEPTRKTTLCYQLV